MLHIRKVNRFPSAILKIGFQYITTCWKEEGGGRSHFLPKYQIENASESL